MGTPTLRTNALTTLEALKQLLGIDETDTSQGQRADPADQQGVRLY